MKILVTGASGRIGSEVTSQLLEQGYSVVGFDINQPKNKLPGVNYVTGSLTDEEAIMNSLSGVDSVAHLAAVMSWNPADDTAMFQANVNGTLSLLRASVRHDVSRFVFASTGEVYPEVLPIYQPIDENHPLEPASLYGETKKIGEELVRFFQQREGLPSVVLRFPHTQTAMEILDPDSFFSGPRFFLQSKIRQMRLLNKHDAAEMLQSYVNAELQHIIQRDENGESYRMHICDVRDTSAGVVLALTHPDAVGETFNLTNNEPVVFSEIVPEMAKITGCEVVSVNMPGSGVRYNTKNDKIKKVLGFEPRFPFEKMLREAAAAWRKREANNARSQT